MLAQAVCFDEPESGVSFLGDKLLGEQDGWEYILSCFDSDSHSVGAYSARIARYMLLKVDESQRKAWLKDICDRLIQRRTSTSCATWNWVVRTNAARVLQGEIVAGDREAQDALLYALYPDDLSPRWSDVARTAVCSLGWVRHKPRIIAALRRIEKSTDDVSVRDAIRFTLSLK